MQYGLASGGTLRQKVTVDTSLSDKELFEALPLGDKWDEALLVDTFFYLLQNKSLAIPSSWAPAMMKFKEELQAFAYWKQLTRGLWKCTAWFFGSVSVLDPSCHPR